MRGIPKVREALQGKREVEAEGGFQGREDGGPVRFDA